MPMSLSARIQIIALELKRWERLTIYPPETTEQTTKTSQNDKPRLCASIWKLTGMPGVWFNWWSSIRRNLELGFFIALVHGSIFETLFRLSPRECGIVVAQSLFNFLVHRIQHSNWLCESEKKRNFVWVQYYRSNEDKIELDGPMDCWWPGIFPNFIDLKFSRRTSWEGWCTMASYNYRTLI